MKLKMTRLLLLAVVVSFAAFLAGCNDRGAQEGPGFNNGSNPDGPDGPTFCEDPTQLFTIESIAPVDGTTGVSIGAEIVVEFSHEPAERSIKSSLNNELDLITLISAGGNEVPLSYTLNGDTVFFKPTTSPLSENTLYTFTIKTSTDSISRPSAVQAADCANGANPKYVYLTDENGDPVDTKETDFTTGLVNDLAVVDTVPADNDDGEPIAMAGAQVQPVITFNQDILAPVVCEGTSAAIILEHTPDIPDDAAVPGAGICSVSVDGNVVTFTPGSPLIVGDDYRLTVKSGADGVQPENPLADPLAEDEVIDFGISALLVCDAPLASICVLSLDKSGLVNVLLNGPLAPIADELGGKDELVTILTNLLENDDGSLGSLVKGLIQDGQLQEALQTLLLDQDLQDILADLLASLPDVLTDGVGGLVEALATGTDTSACDAAVGTVCLVGSGDGTGLLDLLAGDGGFLNSAGLSQDKLVEILGQTLMSGDGSLQGLVEGLFQDGQLQKGLQAILLGTEDYPGLLQSLPNTLTEVGTGLVQTLGTLLGVNLSGLDDGSGTTPLSGLLELLGIGAIGGGGGGGGGAIADTVQGIIDGLTNILTGGLGGLTP